MSPPDSPPSIGETLLLLGCRLPRLGFLHWPLLSRHTWPFNHQSIELFDCCLTVDSRVFYLFFGGRLFVHRHALLSLCIWLSTFYKNVYIVKAAYSSSFHLSSSLSLGRVCVCGSTAEQLVGPFFVAAKSGHFPLVQIFLKKKNFT